MPECRPWVCQPPPSGRVILRPWPAPTITEASRIPVRLSSSARERLRPDAIGLAGKRLLIAPELKHAKALLQELSTFRVKVNYIPRISRKSAARRKRMSKFRIGPLVTSHEVQCVRQ
jgi:hypothetical protein